MLRMAICDDDPAFLQDLCRKIAEWRKMTGLEEQIAVVPFTDSAYLAGVVKETPYDIFLLDVEMPKMDGLQLAERIRRLLPFSIILFLTGHAEFAPEGYKVEALRYISKLALSAQLHEALDAALMKFRQLDGGSLTVSVYNNYFRIPYREIVYVRHVQRSTQIITVSQRTYRDSRGINAIFREMDDERFVFIDRGTFVNMDHIRQIQGSEILLRTNEKLSSSRKMLPKVKEAVNRYLGG